MVTSLRAGQASAAKTAHYSVLPLQDKVFTAFFRSTRILASARRPPQLCRTHFFSSGCEIKERAEKNLLIESRGIKARALKAEIRALLSTEAAASRSAEAKTRERAVKIYWEKAGAAPPLNRQIIVAAASVIGSVSVELFFRSLPPCQGFKAALFPWDWLATAAAAYQLCTLLVFGHLHFTKYQSSSSKAIVIYPKYSTHWPGSSVAHTIDGVCSKISFSLFKFFGWKNWQNE